MAKVDLVTIDPARINDVCDAYFKWKDLNNRIKNYCSRGLNFPETISEPMACYALSQIGEETKWNKGSSGDAVRAGKKIEIKATSNFNSDLTSFGPKCEFDNLVFLRLDYENNKLYIYDTGINSHDIKFFSANKTQTIGEQQAEKRRPRISLIKCLINANHLKSTCIFNIQQTKIEYES